MLKTSRILYPYFLLSFVVTLALVLTTALWWYIPSVVGVFLAVLYFWTFRKYELYFFKNRGWQPRNLLLVLLGSNLLLAFLLSTFKTNY